MANEEAPDISYEVAPDFTHHQWAEELKDVARDAEDVITSVKRMRRWRRIFSPVDRHKISKDLERIKNRIMDISQGKISQHTNIGVLVETQEASVGSDAESSPYTAVARALQKLSSVLEGERLLEMVETVRSEAVIMEKIVSNLRSTKQLAEREKVWVKEVDEVGEVCGSAISVIEEFTKENEAWLGMGWFKRLGLLVSLQVTESNFVEKMSCVKTQIGGVLRRGLTYVIEEESVGVRDKMEDPLPLVDFMANVLSRSLRTLIIGRVIYFTIYLIIFRLLDSRHLLSPYVVSAFIALLFRFALPMTIIVDVWKAKPGQKLEKLQSSILSFDFLLCYISLTTPTQLMFFLQIGSVLLAVINLIRSKLASVDDGMGRGMESIKRELALMHAFLECGEGENERHRIWIKKIRVVAEQARALVSEYELKMSRYKQLGAFRRFIMKFGLLKLTTGINEVLRKMHYIYEWKTIYCIPNIKEREGVSSWGQSTQGSESELRDDDSGAEEDPFLPAVSSNNYELPVKGLVQQGPVESIREEMELMEALFKDVEGMREVDGLSRIWVGEMRGIDSEIKLVSNEHANKLEGKPIHVYIWNYLAKFAIHKKIRHIRNEIQDASRRRKAYGLFSIQTQAQSTSTPIFNNRKSDRVRAS